MAEKEEEPIGYPPAIEMMATSTFYAFAMGSTYGLLKGVWDQKPSTNPQMKSLPVPYAQIAQNCASTGVSTFFFEIIVCVYT